MAFKGERGKLNRLIIFDNQTGKQSQLAADGAFIFIGLSPNSDFLKNSGIQLNPWGFVVTGRSLISEGSARVGFENRDPYLMETSLPGIFAAGDVRDTSTKQVVSAAGEGSTAALAIREYLKQV